MTGDQLHKGIGDTCEREREDAPALADKCQSFSHSHSLISNLHSYACTGFLPFEVASHNNNAH